MRPFAVAVFAAVCLVAAPAHAQLGGPAVPPPTGCTAVTITLALASNGSVCVHRVLVTQTTNATEQNHTEELPR